MSFFAFDHTPRWGRLLVPNGYLGYPISRQIFGNRISHRNEKPRLSEAFLICIFIYGDSIPRSRQIFFAKKLSISV